MSIPAPRKKFHGNEILRDLIPLNALTGDRFKEVTASLVIEDIGAGSYLFEGGDLHPDHQLTGQFELDTHTADVDAVMLEIKAAFAEEQERRGRLAEGF